MRNMDLCFVDLTTVADWIADWMHMEGSQSLLSRFMMPSYVFDMEI